MHVYNSTSYVYENEEKVRKNRVENGSSVYRNALSECHRADLIGDLVYHVIIRCNVCVYVQLTFKTKF